MVDGEENGSLDVNFQSIEEMLATKLDSLQLLLEKKQQEMLQDAAIGTGDTNPILDGNSQDYLQKTAKQFNQYRIQSSHTSINEIIVSLGASRSSVSSSSRELMLAQLYKLIVSRPLVVYNEEQIGTDQYVTDDMVGLLLKVLTSGDYRSPTEFLLLYRSCIALLCSDIEEFGTLVLSDFLSYISKLIQEPATSVVTNENKASVITGLALLLTILHNGSSSFGIDDKISWLIEIAEGFTESSIQLLKDIQTGDREYSTLINDESDDKRIVNESNVKASGEAAVAIAALHGCACLLTLIAKGDFLNEFVTDLTAKLVTILDNDVNYEISKAAGRAIAICYEIYSYSEDEEDNDDDVGDDSELEYNYNAPYYEQEQLFSILSRLASLSSHKISKKEKKVTHSIFRDILSTTKTYTNPEERIEIYKKSPRGMEIVSEMMESSSYIKLSKSRSLPINSWFLYIRLIHLKWTFSFGVHNQLTSNESIRDILREPATDFQERYGSSGADHLEAQGDYGTTERFETDDKKRTNMIRKARVNKLAEEIEDLQLGEGADKKK